MQESSTDPFSMLRPLGQSRLLNMAGGVVNFGINSSTRMIKGSLHLVDRSVGTSVNLTKSAIGLVRNSVNLGCDLAIGVVDVGKKFTTGVIKNVEDKVEYATDTTKKILHVGTMMPAMKTHAKLQIAEEEEGSLINRNRLKKRVQGQKKSEVADLTRLVLVAEQWNADVNKESPIVGKKEKDVGVKRAEAPESAGGRAGKYEQEGVESKKRKVSEQLHARQLISQEFKNELSEKRREFERRRPKRPLTEKLKLDIQSRRKAFDERLAHRQLLSGSEFKRELLEMRREFDVRQELKIEEQRHQRELAVKRKEFQERKKHDRQLQQKRAEEKKHDQEVRLLSQKEKKQRQLESQRKQEEEAKQLHEQQEQLKENRRKTTMEEKLQRDVEIKRRMDYEEAKKHDAEKREQLKREKQAKDRKVKQDKIWSLKGENAYLREMLARLKEEKLIVYTEHFPTLPKKEEAVELEKPKEVVKPKEVEKEKPKEIMAKKPKVVEKEKLKEAKKEKPIEGIQKERLPLDQDQEIVASNVLSKPVEAHEHHLELLREAELPSREVTEQEELTATEKFFVQHVVQPNVSFADAVKKNPEEAELKRKRFEDLQAKKDSAKEFHRDKHAVPQEVVLQDMKAVPIKTENPFDILTQADAMSA